ncbi:unnamed protein product [Cyclocybe aegerita]|uniref:BTB domain-containing protein n=1 Tax=Cyclocybe aegerita TaxID=1973307 RepID=A0A8S0W6H9_CYCAE|nr:unnamed protein product [Cyclocybe aegerita]
MTVSWTTFQCNNSDFRVRLIPDGTEYPVSRLALQRSEVFRDMFACCDTANQETSSGSEGGEEDVLELHEKSGDLAALLRLLHDPPAPPSELPRTGKFDPIAHDPATIIPLPLLLSVLFVLADKYAVEEAIGSVLRQHLLAHAPTHALEVYGFASWHGMDWEASAASQYVLPLASYRFEEVKLIPNVAAYHKLVRLQDFRVKALRDLLLGEEIFPHSYGECSSQGRKTMDSWDRQRKALMGRIECGESSSETSL